MATLLTIESKISLPAAERAAKCISCGMWSEKVGDNWLTDTYIDYDDEGPFVSGSDLVEAGETEHGFVCSDVCRSQAMYTHAEPIEREALDKVLDALRVIQEYGSVVRNLVNSTFPDAYFSHEEAETNLKVMLGDGEPAWSNREAL